MKIGLFLIITVFVIVWSDKRYQRRCRARIIRERAAKRAAMKRILGVK